MKSNDKSRSWFCVLNNPENVFPDADEEQIVQKVLDSWCNDNPARSGAVIYCISADGLKHLHMVLEDKNQARFSAIKKAFPKAHIEPTMGTKKQAEDYINKRGKFEEKGETIICKAEQGEISGAQGSRKDFDVIQQMIDDGFTPKQIMASNFGYRRYDKWIRDAFFDKRYSETPVIRNVEVIWLFGSTGTGKTYTITELIETYGEDEVYVVTDYQSGFDKYNAEKILVLDEFRGQIPFHTMLSILDVYKSQVHARYTNVYSLWDKVYITSPFSPRDVYRELKNNSTDSLNQLYRRITKTVLCYKEKGEYKKLEKDGACDKGDFSIFVPADEECAFK